MSEENVMKHAKGLMKEPLLPFYKAAKKASIEGKLKLVDERIVPPFDGAGFELGRIRGSEAHDEIFYEQRQGYHRRTNRSGGLKGGMTHGAPVVVKAVMKPISTLSRPLASVDVATKQERAAFKERSDICAVPAAAVVAEAEVAFVLAQALVDKFGGDSIAQLDAAVERYRDQLG